MSIITEKTVHFKVDAEFYKQMKIRVVNEDKTLKGYVIDLIKKDLEQAKTKTE